MHTSSDETSRTERPDEIRPRASAVFPSNPNRPAYSVDGVDLTLIRWMLSLTPSERLEALQTAVQSIQQVRNAQTRH